MTIREHLKSKHINLSSLARGAGLSPQSLNYHLNQFDDGNQLPLDLIVAIAEVAQESIDITLENLKSLRS